MFGSTATNTTSVPKPAAPPAGTLLFDWKRSSFGGFYPQNKGQTGFSYIHFDHILFLLNMFNFPATIFFRIESQINQGITGSNVRLKMVVMFIVKNPRSLEIKTSAAGNSAGHLFWGMSLFPRFSMTTVRDGFRSD